MSGSTNGRLAAAVRRRARVSAPLKGLVVAVVVAVSAALALTAAAPAGAATLPAAGGAYQLVVKKSGMCVDVPGASKDPGAMLQQWGCTPDSTWQQFNLKAAGNDQYQLVSVNSGLCIDVPHVSKTSGVQLEQWTCGDNKPNQLWTLNPSGTGTYQIISVNSGLCISDLNASTTSGNPVIQETCTANSNKQWAFQPTTGSTNGGTTGGTSTTGGTTGGSDQGTATVAADGSGTYRTVQAAIDAVPSGNTQPAVITIKPGTYREIVTVPQDKPYITLRGLGSSPGDTVIVDNHNAGDYGTSNSATMFVNGHDFTATNLTVSNDFDENQPNTGAQAVALNLRSDRSVFEDVRLLGDQDTFLVNGGARTYMVDSYVEGTVDFIFGDGTIVFNACTIHEKRSTGGPITAASTDAANPYGFLFYRSTITGATDNTTQLGRPWRPAAQVLYRESSLSATIAVSQPWINMSGNSWQNARFFEYRNTGAGATTNGNRPQMSDSQAANYTPQKYLAGTDGWNPI